MLRHFFICLGLLLSLFAQADEVAVPQLLNRVTDLTATLNPNQQATLEAQLAQFEQASGSQIAILMVPTTAPEAIEQYSIRVTDQWKLGRKGIADGVLILVAKNDRKMRIEVGRGLEGAIPDIYAKRIIAEVMKPAFKQGDFFGGLSAAIEQLEKLIHGEALPAPSKKAQQRQQQNNSQSWEHSLPLLLFGGLFLGGILRAIFGNFTGGALNGGVLGLAVWFLGGSLIFALVLGFIAFIFTLAGISGIPFFGGGGSGGGNNDVFSGGGGDFGGGGASGDW